MYWIRTGRAISDLKKGVVTHRDALNAFIVFHLLIVTGIATYNVLPISFRCAYYVLENSLHNVCHAPLPFVVVIAIRFFCVVTPIVLTIRGIRRCFTINQRGDGKDFFIRFFCLSIPTTLRITLGALVSTGIFALLMHTYYRPIISSMIRSITGGGGHRVNIFTVFLAPVAIPLHSTARLVAIFDKAPKLFNVMCTITFIGYTYLALLCVATTAGYFWYLSRAFKKIVHRNNPEQLSV